MRVSGLFFWAWAHLRFIPVGQESGFNRTEAPSVLVEGIGTKPQLTWPQMLRWVS